MAAPGPKGNPTGNAAPKGGPVAAPSSNDTGKKSDDNKSGNPQTGPTTIKPVDMTALKKANLPMVVVMGGPGCGKGTQCDKIKAKYHFCHLSTGDLLRDEAKADSARGKSLNATMAKGELVSLDIVMQLLKEAMVKFSEKDKGCHGFLIDGFPRDTQQAEALTKEIGLPKAAIYFECPDDVMTKRLLARGKSSGRVDDNEESVKKRLEVFKKQTLPVIAFYKDKNLLKTIPANREVEQIFADVQKVMDPLHPKHD